MRARTEAQTQILTNNGHADSKTLQADARLDKHTCVVCSQLFCAVLRGEHADKSYDVAVARYQRYSIYNVQILLIACMFSICTSTLSREDVKIKNCTLSCLAYF